MFYWMLGIAAYLLVSYGLAVISSWRCGELTRPRMWRELAMIGIFAPLVLPLYLAHLLADAVARLIRGNPPRDWHRHHHPACGTQYRGCHPRLCPKDQYEKTGRWPAALAKMVQLLRETQTASGNKTVRRIREQVGETTAEAEAAITGTCEVPTGGDERTMQLRSDPESIDRYHAHKEKRISPG